MYEINGEILSTEGIAQRLRNITSAQVWGQQDHDEDLRLSIAGAQEKTALLRHDTEQDRNNFIKTQIIFWVLAATDGHGKNFSIAHRPGGRYRATPIYDVLSAHPVIGQGKNQISPHKAKLAMAVRGSANCYLIKEIQRRHWIAQAQQVGLGAAAAGQLIEEVIEATESVIGEVGNLVPDDFPMDMAEAVFRGMRSQSAKLADVR